MTSRRPAAAPSGLGLTPEQLRAWPGADRRSPSRGDRHRLVLQPLAAAISTSIDRLLAGRENLDVLDVGCGCKPYLPFFASTARSYRGLDPVPGPWVDDVGSAEALPYPDASFDVVLCTQVLEHVFEPDRVVREIYRILRPGGVAMVSTHGVFLYHPDPPDSEQDFWRWTHAGLVRLFRTQADWAQIEVAPNGDVAACLGYIACQFVDEAGQRLGVERVRRGLVAAVNAVSAAVDRRYPPRARVPAGGSLSANYLLTATKPA